MKLYSLAFSPYASRCRIQVFHKNLGVEIVAPPGGLGSSELRARNPIGKVPVLDLGDQSLAESAAIMEYLEARFPETPMRPSDPLEAARLTELVRFTDLYLATLIVDCHPPLDFRSFDLRVEFVLFARTRVRCFQQQRPRLGVICCLAKVHRSGSNKSSC